MRFICKKGVALLFMACVSVLSAQGNESRIGQWWKQLFDRNKVKEVTINIQELTLDENIAVPEIVSPYAARKIRELARDEIKRLQKVKGISVTSERDGEVMKAAIGAAETGQLVLGTMHTVNVTQTLSRLTDAFPVEQHAQVRLQLSELIRGIVCQRLLPTIKPGMRPALEIMVSTPQIRKLIMENKPSDIQKQMQNGAFYGMQTFDQALAKLYQEGAIDMETATSAATSPDAIMLAIRGVTDSLAVAGEN